MIRTNKMRANGSVVSAKPREGQGVFVQVRAPNGQLITSMDRKVYENALASAKASLRKKAVAAG